MIDIWILELQTKVRKDITIRQSFWRICHQTLASLASIGMFFSFPNVKICCGARRRFYPGKGDYEFFVKVCLKLCWWPRNAARVLLLTISHRRDHHNFDIPRPNYPALARPEPAPSPATHQPRMQISCAGIGRLRCAARLGRWRWGGPPARWPGEPRWWSNSIGLNGTCEIYLISFGYIKYYLAFELRLQV